MQKEIDSLDFHDLFEEKYKEYANEVIENRALIDYRDGLKPVHRRILWSMFDSKITDKGNTVKVAKISGAVMGNLHPHGDSSIEDALVRLTQDFSLREPLIIGQGNFGDADGNPAAASRYIEAKLSPAGMMMLEDTADGIVEFVDNYDGSCKEPIALASKFPNILINGGGAGMAVGIAFKDCSHNPKEICDAIKAVIDNPKLPIDDLLKIVKGPDWNCGGYVVDNAEIKRYIETGKGSLTVFGKFRIETVNSKTSIVIEELPFQYGQSQFMTDIAKDIKLNPTGILANYISKFKDLSDMKTGTHIAIELKTGCTPQLIINELKSKTGFKQNIPVNMNILFDGVPKQIGLAGLISCYIGYRRDIVKNKLKKTIQSLERSLVRSEALLAATGKMDEIIELIKGSNNPETACTKIMKLLAISEEQAQYILDIPLKRLTKLESSAIKKENDGLKKSLQEAKDVLNTPSKIDNILKNDLDDIQNICNCNRKTKLIKDEEIKITTKPSIEKEGLYLMVNFDLKSKFVRKFNKDLSDKEKNSIMKVYPVSNMDYVIGFNDLGQYQSSRIYNYEVNNRNASGSNLFQELNDMNDIQSFSENDQYLISLTSDGKVKKSKLSDLPVANKKIMDYIKLSTDSKVICNLISENENEYVIITDDAYVLRFSADKIGATGRLSQGVQGISKRSGNPVRILAIPQSAKGQIVILTENGYGKKVELEEIPVANRGGKGILISKVTKDTGKIADACYTESGDSILAVTNVGSTVSFEYDEIMKRSRIHKGDILVDMIMNQKISKIENIIK